MILKPTALILARDPITRQASWFAVTGESARGIAAEAVVFLPRATERDRDVARACLTSPFIGRDYELADALALLDVARDMVAK